MADLSIDISFVADALAQADRNSKPSLLTENWPTRMKTAGGWYSKGGLTDSVEGVRAGERWSFVLHLYRPGHQSGKRVVGRYVWEDDLDADTAERSDMIEDTFGTGAPQATLKLDLTTLFQKLPPLSF